MFKYEDENIFAKILKKQIPCNKVHESENTLAFNDIRPQKKVHIVVIPKGKYVNYSHFIENAKEEEILDFFKSIKEIVKNFSLEEKGYRIITNQGEHGGQEVFHFHAHILAGESVGKLTC